MSKKTVNAYLHGYSQTEQNRLRYQASFNEQRIYQDVDFSRVKKLLEVGCGVGAQSEILMRRFPKLRLTGVDLNEQQLESAKKYLGAKEYLSERYEIHKMDASNLSFDSNEFDGAFLCWVLEHVPSPQKVLAEVRRVLCPGSTIFITEVLNSSFFLDPYSPNVWKYWMEFNDYQLDMGGDPFIGAKLGNLLLSSGYQNIQTHVRTMFFDNRSPEERKETIEFWTDLLMSAKDFLIQEGRVNEELADAAQKELRAVARDPNAVFYFNFIQAQAKVF